MLDIARGDIGRTDASTFRTGTGGGNWCAYWLSSVLERAGLPTPLPSVRARRGARALTRWAAARGRWVVTPEQAVVLARKNEVSAWRAWVREHLRPGDIIAWRASKSRADWRGHVALVEGIDIERGGIVTIGGNERGAVRHTVLAADKWPWRRRGGLYGVARP